MSPAALEHIAAHSLDEVLDALADGDTAVLAGGQSLTAEPGLRRIVDINPVPDFDSLELLDTPDVHGGETGGVRVGPLVRHRMFETDAVPGALGRLLRRVVHHIGHPPVRARGTMLGSLAHAHTAAEWTVLATLLDARLGLIGRHGPRHLTTDQFFLGPHETARRADELLLEVRLRALPDGTGTGYAEYRHHQAIWAEAATMTAITVTDGIITTALIGLVNAGPCPVRARTAERALIGAPFSDAAITAAATAAADTDANLLHRPATARPALRRAVRTLTRRALTQAREDCS